MVQPAGFEPATLGFRDRSSTAELKAALGCSHAKRRKPDLAPKSGTLESALQQIEREARERVVMILVPLLTSRFANESAR